MSLFPMFTLRAMPDSTIFHDIVAEDTLFLRSYRSKTQMLSILFDNFGAITFSSVMGVDKGDTSAKKYPIGPDGKRLKPCCACPETKRARDACIIENGEENCTDLIEAHKACMRNLGFNI